MNEVKYYLPFPYKLPDATLPELRGKMFLGEKKATYILCSIDRGDREKDFIEKYSDRIVRVQSSNFVGVPPPKAFEKSRNKYIFFTDSKIELLYQLSFGNGPQVINLQRQCTLWEKIKDMVKNI